MNKNLLRTTWASQIRTAWLLGVLCWLGFGTSASAQVSAYVFSQISGTYTPITGGTVVVASGAAPASNDVNYPSQNIGFTFNYAGSNYTQFGISSNGYIWFDTGEPSTFEYTPISSSSANLGGTGTVTGVVSALGRDILKRTTTPFGELRVETTGTAGSQVCTIQFTNWRGFGLGTSAVYNFQIKLFEGTNVVQLVYGAFTMTGATASSDFQVGLRGANNTEFRTVLGSAANWAGATLGTLNSTSSTLSTTVFPSSGTTFNFTPPTPCTGTPTAGIVNAPASACAGTNFNLSLTGSSQNSGITYQWQSSPDGVAPYTNIAGATSSGHTGNQTASTFYRCNVTCTASSQTVSTPGVQVTMSGFLSCYCPATYSSGGTTDNITNVLLGTLSNNTTAAGNPLPYYTYYSALPKPDLAQNGTQTLTVTVGSDGNQFVTAWIDWNQNGALEASENIGISINVGASGIATFNFSVPGTAVLGNTRLRIRGGDDAAATAAQACGATNSAWGETEDYDVNIIAPPSLDIQPLVLVAPAASGCYTATNPVTVTIQNAGAVTLNFVTNPVTITTNVTGAVTATLTSTVNTGTLASGATLDVNMSSTLNMSTPGIYTFNVSLAMTGDVNTANNTLPATTRTVTPSVSLPLSVITFTGFDGGNIATISPGWSEATGSTAPTGNFGGWFPYTNTAASPNLGADGNVMARINYYSFNQGNDWFVGPKFVATATSELKFSTATTPWPDATGSATIGDDDGIRVMISTNCGASWTQVTSFLGSANFTETLTEKSVSLATYAGQQVIIGIQGTTGAVVDPDPDFYLYLDDIRVIAPVALDVQPLSLVAPSNPGCYTATQGITVKIRNNGTNPLNLVTTPVTVTTNVSGGATATLTATANTGTIAANGGELDVVMTGTFNMSAFASYTFGVTTSVAGDGNTLNDNNASLATLTHVAPATLPQNVNFTGFNGDNITTLFPNWYEAIGLTTPTPAATFAGWGSFTNTAASPNLGTVGNVLARINYYSFSQGQNWFVGPKFTATTTSTLKFSTATTPWPNAVGDATIGDDDGIEIMVSTNCGLTWVVANSFLGTANFTATLTEKTVSLAAYNGQQIIVAVRGTTGAVVDAAPDYYLYLDNIRVYDAAPIDMAAVELVSPGTSGCYGANQTVTVKVKNFGALPMNFATNPTTVTVNVTGAATQTLTATLNTGTLAVDGTQDVIVSTTFDMTAFGTYTFNANTAVTVGVDGDATNNAMVAVDRTLVAPLTLPLTVVNYTGYNGGNIATVFPGWNEAQGITNPTGTTAGWDSFTSTATTPNLGAAGNVVTRINYWSFNQTHDWFIGPKVTATATSEFRFKIAATQYNFSEPTVDGIVGSDDEVRVRVSTNCGLTWTTVQAFGATSGLTATLTEKVVSLGAYAGQQIIVAVQGTVGTVTDTAEDYYFFLDDLAVRNCIPPAITTQPTSALTICQGTATTTISVVATGDDLAYQWQVNTGSGFANVSNGMNYSGATTASLNILTMPATFDTYQYRLVITGSCGNVTSNVSTLTVSGITAFNTTSASNATVGTTYSINAGVTGNTNPVTYSITPALPAGLNFSTTSGLISGTPTAPTASTTYTVTATLSGPCTFTQSYTFAVNCPVLTFNSTTASNATVGTAYTLNAGVTGSTTTVTYSVSPALPAGLTLDTNTGIISGTATASAVSTTYTVTASQSGPCSATQSYTFAAVCSNIVFTNTTASNAVVNVAYSLNAGVTGNTAPITYSVSPVLPAGLSLNTSTGEITGTPTTPTASATYTVTATQIGCVATQAYTFAVNCPSIVFTVTSASAATVGTAYSLNAGVTGGNATITYSISPALPAGLSMSTTTGLISGTPTASAASTAYTVTASQTGPCTATQVYTFAVNCPSIVFAVTSASAATVGTAYSLNAGVTGNTTPITYSVSPALPAGLSMSTTTGLISGTPTAPTASATYTVTAAQTGCTVTQTYTFAVNCPSIVFAVTSASAATVGTAYSLNAGVTGNTTPITYSVSPALPAGLSMSATTGLITGTPTASAASTTYTVTASQTGCTVTQAYTFAVNCPSIVFTVTSASAATVGTAYSLNAGVTGNTTPITYSVSPALPAGLGLNTSTGSITGTPTAPTASATYTVTATQTGCTVTQAYTFAVNCPTITFTVTTAPAGVVGTAYSLNAGVTGTTTTVTYSVSPALPAGLSLNTSTGLISGTPTASVASATYTVTASQSGPCSATQTYTFGVTCPAIVFTNTSASNGFVGAAYSLNAGVTGNTTTITYSVSPALPAGLSLNTSTGAITGTPTAVTASATYTVTASQTGCSATQAYTFSVDCAIITFTTQPASTLIKGGTNTSFTVAATSILTLSYQWQVNSGSGFVNITNNATYGGATTATLSITNATSALNNYSYRCVVSTVCRTENSASAILNINVIPTFTTVAITDVLEDSGARTLNNWATGVAGPSPLESGQVLTYQMGTITNGGLFSAQPTVVTTGNTATLTYTPAPNANGTATFQVRISDGLDESSYQTFTINVTPVNDEPTLAPVANFEQVVGSTVTVNLTGIAAGGGSDESTQTFTVIPVATSGVSVVEFPTTPIIVSGGNATFGIKLLTAGDATIRVTVRDNGGVLNGGDDSVERIFTIKANIQAQAFVPTIFSPNGDGDNDKFRVKVAKGAVETLKLEIFNDRGDRVYFSDVIEKIVEDGWDGKYNNIEQPQGVYGWKLSGKFKDGRDIKATDGERNNVNKGNINLIRGTK